VTCLGLVLAPLDESQLEHWRSLFLSLNPGMDRHTGDFQVVLSAPYCYFVDVHYVDSSLKVTREPGGARLVSERAEAPCWATAPPA